MLFYATLGTCCGIALKKSLKLLAIGIGGGFLFTQYLAYNNYIDVKWKKVAEKGGSKVVSFFKKLGKMIFYKLPMTGSFCASFALGYRYG